MGNIEGEKEIALILVIQFGDECQVSSNEI